MVHLKLFFFLYSTAVAQTFQTYPNHQAAFDYQRLITKTSEECQAACTSDPKCVTYNPTSTGCYLSSTDKHTFYCTNATLFRKQNRSQCGTTVCDVRDCSRWSWFKWYNGGWVVVVGHSSWVRQVQQWLSVLQHKILFHNILFLLQLLSLSICTGMYTN